jgi:cytochrome c-type biogenesis protein CcmH
MYKRALQLVLITFVAFTMLGASNPAAHFNRMGHNFMCACGCSQILLECNHTSCPASPGQIADLHSQIDAGAADAAIYKFFEAKYGPTVLAAPVRGGFDTVAWIGPFAFLLFGIIVILIVLRLWKARHDRLSPVAAVPATPDADALRNRIRDETNYGE